MHLFPYLPRQSGYNKRLRAASGLLQAMIRVLAIETRGWSDDIWLIDSTPVECGRSRPTAQRSDIAGWAGYGYCASHSRYFWGLRLHLVCTPARAAHHLRPDQPQDRRTRSRPRPARDRPRACSPPAPAKPSSPTRATLSREFEAFLTDHGARLLRPAFKKERPRPGARLLKPLRQIIESVNDTLKGQLDLERHGGRTRDGVAARVLQRVLALTAAIWHNDTTDQPVLRSLIAYDH